MNTDFNFAGMSVDMMPAITKWDFGDLGDEPEKHRWRAWWADDGRTCCGIELRAYPVIKINPASVWINEDGRREATKQPWEEGAPCMKWIPFNPTWMRKRICYNATNAAWAKPTQEEAIQSLAIRLVRWTAHLSRTAYRAEDSIKVLESLRPEWTGYLQAAQANLASIKKP